MTTQTLTKAEAGGEAFGLPSASVLRRLKISREVAWYMVARGYEFPEHGPLHKTPEASRDKGAVFDPEKVDKVVAAFKVLRHTQGKWAGKPLVPAGWQIAYVIAPVFGWVKQNEDGKWVRVVRTLYVDVPRKNGKSTLSGGLAVYLTGADGEQGAQVVAAASTKDQAGFVFAPIKTLVEKSPALKGRFIPRTGKILHPKSGSYFGVISSSADAQHGANIHGAIIDELHIHKTPDLVEALETGTGSRDQPLVVMITTADSGKPNTIYSRKRKMIEQLARGVIQDPSTYGVVFGLPDTADPLNPKNFAKANPNYPVSPTRPYIEGKARVAKNSPVDLASYKRLHMGMRTKQTTAWVSNKKWAANAGARLHRADLAGRVAYGGIDLGSVSDLTALCWMMPHAGSEPGYDVVWRFWAPEDSLEDLDKRTANAASTWVKDGWLTLTPGNVTDYDWVKQDILADMEFYDVQTIGFDPWNATQLVNDLLGDGLPMVQVRQGFITMSPAMKEIQRLVLMGDRSHPRLRHGNNPVMVWMTDNLAVKMDPSGNVKPDKAEAGDKIDGWSALATATSEAINDDQFTYADDDLTIA